MNKDMMIAAVTAANDQDREGAKQWMREASMADRLAVWMRIQKNYKDPVDEIMSRLAQLAFGEIMVEVDNEGSKDGK